MRECVDEEVGEMECLVEGVGEVGTASSKQS